jgi:YD repeat-containing protein
LAWNKDAKQLAWYSTGGSQPVLSGAAQATIACGASPTWPTGDKLIVYHGGPTAAAQLVSLADPAAAPTALGDSSALSCDLGGRTAFSPDGKRLALLKYTSNITVAGAIAAGTFSVISVADGTVQGSIDNVNTYSLENDGALLVHLILNSKNQADQADLGYWDAATNKERFLERSIKSSDKCFFVSASVVHVADKVYTAFGENCTAPAGAGYRILRTDFAGGNSSNWVQHTGVSGSYFSYTSTNYLTVLPDNQTLLLAVPNGLKSRVANLLRVNIADATVTPLIQSVEMDSSPQNGPRRFLFNAQGTLLAFVIVNLNNGETLYVYDLTKPTQAPAAVTDTNRSNQVTGLAWNAAGNRIVYTVTGDDASLSYFDLTAGKNLVTRGVFQGLALSADGQTAATVEQVKPTPTDIRYNLVAISLADGTKTALVTGDKGAAAMDVLALR